ncbi:MAG: Fur family transcriptional regulator [Gemmatimonadales bacterium]
MTGLAKFEAQAYLERFRRWLREHRQPLTRQRELVAEAVFNAPAQVSVEEVRSRLATRGERIGLATIYRAMDTLVTSGLVRGHDFGEGFRRFEPVGPRSGHEHLVCDRCGRVTGFASGPLERLLQLVADEHGFELAQHRLEVHGTCRDCRRRGLPGL